MNPILPLDICMPDGEPRVFGERLYLYGSFDELGNHDYCSHRYYVFSASIHDLSCWTNHGLSFASRGPSDEVPWSDAELYAPDVIEKNGVYYLYFCLSDGTEGVATSDVPQGPFTHAKQMFYPSTINNGKALEHIDPAAFVDDDGSVYYYWGQFDSQCAKLEDNMYELVAESYKPKMITEEEHFFHEGSSMRKIGNKYYVIYCDTSTGRANSLAYAIGDHPLGPFDYQGVIINNEEADPESWNNHGSIIKIKEQWYVLYHRSSNNSRFSRRACMEPIQFDDKGKIQQVEMTSQGASHPLNAYTRLLAARACVLKGDSYIGLGEQGTHLLVNNKKGSLAGFKYLDFGNGDESIIFSCRIHVESAAGSVVISLDEPSSSPIASFSLEEIEQGVWTDVSMTVAPITGIRAVYLSFISKNEGISICKVLWIGFDKVLK